MSRRAVAVGLKIPDNAAYTALTTLQRLGIAVARVERNEILVVEFGGDAAQLAREIERDEALFNPNKHRLHVLDAVAPRPGEVWIQEMGRADRFVAWRLVDASGQPVPAATLRAASERLLCNPAIETASYAEEPQ